jgi:hypothetical protein
MDTFSNVIAVVFYAMSCLMLPNNILCLENYGLTGDLLPVNPFIISLILTIFITLFIS